MPEQVSGVITRVLRAHVRVLGRALTAVARDALKLLHLLADDLLAEARQLQPTRNDSFRRLTLLMEGAAAAQGILDAAR